MASLGQQIQKRKLLLKSWSTFLSVKRQRRPDVSGWFSLVYPAAESPQFPKWLAASMDLCMVRWILVVRFSCPVRLIRCAVSPRSVILESLSAPSPNPAIAALAKFVNEPEKAPSEEVTKLIIQRLNRPECISNGWILDGFPQNAQQAAALQSAGLAPNRVVFINTPAETCASRLSQRRYHRDTGRCINLLVLPSDVSSNDLSEYVAKSSDSDSNVNERIGALKTLQQDLAKFYTKTGGDNIFQIVQDDGLGEGEGFGTEGRDPSAMRVKLEPSLERAVEKVEGALMKLAPV